MNNINFFLDESGNTGNINLKGNQFNFKDQPYFILGALQESQELFEEYKILINKFKINKTSEIKSSYIYNKHLSFFNELLLILKNFKITPFIEVTDKKFFLCCQIVDHLFLPVFSLGESKFIDSDIILLSHFLANKLFSILPPSLFELFLVAIHSKEVHDFEECFASFLDFFNNINCEEDPILSASKDQLKETYDDYLEHKKEINLPKPAHHFFLPIEDLNKKDKILNSLVNLPSFTNIVFRINSSFNNKNISLIHDKQDHFDEILKKNFEYSFKESHIFKDNIKNNFLLTFKDSKECIGIQIIDIIVGCLYRAILNSNIELLEEILTHCDINFVIHSDID